MSHTAMIYHQIPDISLWANSTLNNILVIGNNLYSSITCSVQTNDYLLITDVPDMVSIFDKVYTLLKIYTLLISLIYNMPFSANDVKLMLLKFIQKCTKASKKKRNQKSFRPLYISK